ncbi:hypothetical protein [uncultured Roseibium sp.]|uniref:hypothetical protein n=1 Tax=uncultured Roseibium sp. TaxID=1936171 RepID=UPI0032177F3F
MNIDEPGVHSYKVTDLRTVMSEIDDLNGYNLIAYRLTPEDTCADDVIVLDIDPYLENDDEFLTFDGRDYNWEVELFSLKSVKRYAEENGNSTSLEALCDAAKYFLLNRAYAPSD